jgi:hypothetical protein
LGNGMQTFVTGAPRLIGGFLASLNGQSIRE